MEERPIRFLVGMRMFFKLRYLIKSLTENETLDNDWKEVREITAYMSKEIIVCRKWRP